MNQADGYVVPGTISSTEVVGDKRWSYDGQLPYFCQSEKWYSNQNLYHHGVDGKFTIQSPQSTGRAFLLDSQVVGSIIFDTTGSVRATGVRLANGTEHSAKKEAILCAGAYKSS